MSFTDGYWWSNDNLRLHYRDYPGPADRPPIICLPGLTRNARDFEPLAERLSPAWRVIAVDLRGRGGSAYAKDPMTYVPLTYVQDIERLLEALNITDYIPVGTSLGGLVTMRLAAAGHARMAAAIINDVGPVIEMAGIARIMATVGRGGSYPTWVHAARDLGDTLAALYPRYGLMEWLAMAKRLYRLNSAGRVIPDYDKKIAEPFRLPVGEGAIDMWTVLDAMDNVPTLIVRGALSDVFSSQTADAMVARLARTTLVTVPDVGHAPTLDEPEAAAEIDTLLDAIGR